MFVLFMLHYPRKCACDSFEAEHTGRSLEHMTTFVLMAATDVAVVMVAIMLELAVLLLDHTRSSGGRL